MHTCPECGCVCHCSGDIEDHDTGDEYLERCTHPEQCGDDDDDDYGDMLPADDALEDDEPPRVASNACPQCGCASRIWSSQAWHCYNCYARLPMLSAATLRFFKKMATVPGHSQQGHPNQET